MSDEEMRSLVERATASGVEYDEAGYMQSRELMRAQLTAMIAQRLFSTTEYYRYINPRVYVTYCRVLEILDNWDGDIGHL